MLALTRLCSRGTLHSPGKLVAMALRPVHIAVFLVAITTAVVALLVAVGSGGTRPPNTVSATPAAAKPRGADAPTQSAAAPEVQSSVPQREMGSSTESLEYKLAVVDAGGYVRPDDLTVARFRSLLDQLSAKYVENRTQIADMSVTGQKLLREKGVSQSIQSIMEGLNGVLDGPLGNQKYAEYIALYVQLRDSGKGHDAAVATLRGALQELTGR
jgi:hypothetical protein